MAVIDAEGRIYTDSDAALRRASRVVVEPTARQAIKKPEENGASPRKPRKGKVAPKK